MTNTQETKPILLLGGTGKTGRRVAQRLTGLKHPVRIASRSGSPSFDWNNVATWDAILADVSAVYITYQPDLSVPGAVSTLRSFVHKALQAGVTRMVLLSGRGEEEAKHAEDMLKTSGADWTIVRASWFAQNFSESFLLDSLLAGEVILPIGAVTEPFIDVEDIADVVAAALTQPGHSGKLYEVTGPRLLSFADAVQEIAEASGREIVYQQIPDADYAAMLAEYGVPQEEIALVMYLFTTILDGRNESLADGIQSALGRAPRDFSAYVSKTAASGVWKAG